MMEITSKENERVKHLVKLKSKKFRDIYGEYIIEGSKLIRQAMDTGTEILSVFVTQEYPTSQEKEWTELLYFIPSDEVFLLSASLFSSISENISPTGILAVVRKKNMELDKLDLQTISKVVIIDNVRDPGNMGTLIRTADAAGYDLIICSKGCADLYNPKTIRSTVGSIFNIDIITDADLMEILMVLKDHDFSVIGSSLEAKVYYNEIMDIHKFALIFGNEGSGISPEVISLATLNVKIPMLGRAESLNVAVAAGILMYHFSINANAKR
ncbi:MAG: RNA methyltransferase [Eubacteriaceae bacterium]|nr:RNA methyltransferase [Eubacteriaceae bacterium]